MVPNGGQDISKQSQNGQNRRVKRRQAAPDSHLRKGLFSGPQIKYRCWNNSFFPSLFSWQCVALAQVKAADAPVVAPSPVIPRLTLRVGGQDKM